MKLFCRLISSSRFMYNVVEGRCSSVVFVVQTSVFNIIVFVAGSGAKRRSEQSPVYMLADTCNNRYLSALGMIIMVTSRETVSHV